jgi:hypothetical protein
MPTINEQVGEKLKAIAPVVENKVVDLLVDKEVNRRVEIITQGLGKLEELDRESRKLSKPDVESYDGDGNLSSSGYSKVRKEEREKLAQRIDKLTKAVEKAVGGDIGDLANLVNQKGDSK